MIKRFKPLCRILILILMLGLMVSTTACGGSGTSGSKSLEEVTTKSQGSSSKAGTSSNNSDASTSGNEDLVDSYAIVNEAVVFNDAAKAILAHPDARRAIALAVDKEGLVTKILKGTGKQIDYLVPEGLVRFPGGQDFRSGFSAGWHRHNKDAAQALWAKAMEETRVRAVTLHLLIMNSNQMRSVGRHIKAQLESTLPGLTLKLNSYEFNKKLEMAQNGRYGMEIYGWGPDYPDPTTYLDLFHTKNPQNTSGFADPYYDGLLEAAKVKAGPEVQVERLKGLQEAERYLISEKALVVPLYQTGMAFLTKPYLTAIVNQSFGGRFFYKYANTTFTKEGLKVLRTMTQSNVQLLDTGLAQDTISFEVLSNVMEGLVTMDQKGKLAPGVAASWTVGEDGLTYTFKLRRDAKWSNGTRVTAGDFVYAWQRLVNPETASPYQFILGTAQIAGYKAIIEGTASPETLGVVAIDDYTLRVKLENPVPYFLDLMRFAAFYPVSKDFVAYQGAQYGKTAESTLYNGPFVMNQWDNGYGYVLARNSHYWDRASVLLHTITFRQYKDDARALKEYQEGRLDRLQLNVDQADSYREDPEFTLSEEPTVFYMTFNVGNY